MSCCARSQIVKLNVTLHSFTTHENQELGVSRQSRFQVSHEWDMVTATRMQQCIRTLRAQVRCDLRMHGAGTAPG